MGIAVWTGSLLDELRNIGDPGADEVVARYFDQSEKHPRDLMRGLVHHETLPAEQRSPAVDAYCRDEPAWPDWADPEQIRRSQEFFVEWGLLIGMLHYCASLPSAYAVARGVKVLHLTARLATDTGRRIHETGQMIIDAMGPGGLTPGGAGYTDIRRVRLMHAAVRHLILHDPAVAKTCDPATAGPSWCGDWGVPINQEDMLATLLTFTQVIVDGLQKAGVRVTDADAASYFHAWSVAAHLLGVRPDLLPITPASAPQLWSMIRGRQFGPCPEGVEMTAALVRLVQSSLPRWLHGLPEAQIRYFVGDDVADLLALGRGGAVSTAFDPLRRTMSVVALSEQHSRLLRAVSRRLGRAVLAGFVGSGRSGSRDSFSIPTQLAEKWRVPAGRRWPAASPHAAGERFEAVATAAEPRAASAGREDKTGQAHQPEHLAGPDVPPDLNGS
jgi:hypothetical protein